MTLLTTTLNPLRSGALGSRHYTLSLGRFTRNDTRRADDEHPKGRRAIRGAGSFDVDRTRTVSDWSSGGSVLRLLPLGHSRVVPESTQHAGLADGVRLRKVQHHFQRLMSVDAEFRFSGLRSFVLYALRRQPNISKKASNKRMQAKARMASDVSLTPFPFAVA